MCVCECVRSGVRVVRACGFVSAHIMCSVCLIVRESLRVCLCVSLAVYMYVCESVSVRVFS